MQVYMHACMCICINRYICDMYVYNLHITNILHGYVILKMWKLRYKEIKSFSSQDYQSTEFDKLSSPDCKASNFSI